MYYKQYGHAGSGGMGWAVWLGLLRSGRCRREYSLQVGKLNLVDLAGSERVALTGATGQRLEEVTPLPHLHRD